MAGAAPAPTLEPREEPLGPGAAGGWQGYRSCDESIGELLRAPGGQEHLRPWPPPAPLSTEVVTEVYTVGQL